MHVLESVYAHCIDGGDDLISQRIEDALDSDSGPPHMSQCVTASGYTHRRYRHDPVRHMSVNNPSGPAWPTAARPPLRRLYPQDAYLADHFRRSEGIWIAHGRHRQMAGSGPPMAHNQKQAVCVTAPFAR